MPDGDFSLKTDGALLLDDQGNIQACRPCSIELELSDLTLSCCNYLRIPGNFQSHESAGTSSDLDGVYTLAEGTSLCVCGYENSSGTIDLDVHTDGTCTAFNSTVTYTINWTAIFYHNGTDLRLYIEGTVTVGASFFTFFRGKSAALTNISDVDGATISNECGGCYSDQYNLADGFKCWAGTGLNSTQTGDGNGTVTVSLNYT